MRLVRLMFVTRVMQSREEEWPGHSKSKPRWAQHA